MGDYGITGATDLLINDIYELKEALAICLDALEELAEAADSDNIREDDGWHKCNPYLDIPQATRSMVNDAIKLANEVLKNG